MQICSCNKICCFLNGINIYLLWIANKSETKTKKDINCKEKVKFSHGNNSTMISMMLYIIGSEIAKIISLPASKTLSPKLLIPASAQRFAVNSIKYPMPIILITMAKIPEESPVFSTIKLKTPIISVKYSTVNKSNNIPPHKTTKTAISGFICFSNNPAITVTRPMPTICKISKFLPQN